MRNVNSETTTGRVKKTALSLLLATGCIYGGSTWAQSVTDAAASAQSNASLDASASINRGEIVDALSDSASTAAQTSANLAVDTSASLAGAVQSSAESTQESISSNSLTAESDTGAEVLLNTLAVSDDGETSQVDVSAAVNAVTATTVQLNTLQEDTQSAVSSSAEQIVNIGADVSADVSAWADANSQATADTVESVSNAVSLETGVDVATDLTAEVTQQTSSAMQDMADQESAISAGLNSVTEITAGLASGF